MIIKRGIMSFISTHFDNWMINQGRDHGIPDFLNWVKSLCGGRNLPHSSLNWNTGACINDFLFQWEGSKMTPQNWKLGGGPGWGVQKLQKKLKKIYGCSLGIKSLKNYVRLRSVQLFMWSDNFWGPIFILTSLE